MLDINGASIDVLSSVNLTRYVIKCWNGDDSTTKGLVLSKFITEVEIEFAGNQKIKGKVREHHPAHHYGRAAHAAREFFGIKGRNVKMTSAVGISTTPFFTSPKDGSFLNPDDEIDFVEWRFPHSHKARLAQQFASHYAQRQIVNLKNANTLWFSYGRMSPYSNKIMKLGEAASLTKGGIEGGMELGGAVGGVALASGATVATAGLTLGVGVAVVAVAIAGTAANNHRENLRNRQVYFRVSRSRRSLDGYFNYEDKLYTSGSVPPGLSFHQIAQIVNSV